MKTFQEFLKECYICEGLTREQALQKYGSLLARNPHLKIKNAAGSSQPPDWRIRTRDSVIKAAKERQRKIKELENLSIFPSTKRRANKKRKEIIRKGMESHHITPIEHSHQLMSSMSPDEWRERQMRDAKIGIYHGHHPRNLQASSGAKSKNQEGIPHRTDGIHELEGQVKDIISGKGSHESSVSLRDLVAARLKKIRQTRRAEQRKNTIKSKLQSAKTAKDVDRILNKI